MIRRSLLIPRLALLALLLSAAAACGDDDLDPASQTLPAHCNPLSGDSCLLPWPSDFYLKADSGTKTGFRVNYPVKAMPSNVDLDDDKKPGVPVDPTRYNLLDGFSIGSQPLAYFKAGVSSAGLPGQDDIAASLKDSSLVWLLEVKSGKRVPLFAEVDANAEVQESQVGALIIRPQAPLEYETRYAVVLRRGIKDAGGAELKPPEPFRKIRDGETIKEQLLKVEAERLKDVLALLDKKGLKRADVLLAWEFRTGSQQLIQSNLLFLVQDSLKRLASAGVQVADVKVSDKDKSKQPKVLRSITGNMLVPSYLESEAKGSWLKLDAAGKPVYQRMQKFPFFIHIPRCAETATKPLPVFIFGHGLFGTLTGELTSSYHKALQQELCMVTAQGLWMGLSEPDVPDILTEVIIKNFSNLPRITDQLQQAQVNAHALVQLFKGDFLKHKSMQVGGKPVTDGKAFYYLGISNGGIQGVAFAALNKEIERFVFNVSGGMWSLMIQRSSNFAVLAMSLKRRYPKALDRAILVSLSQHLWDYTDPITWGRHAISDPLPGYSKKRIILQESRHDDQVPNISTRVVARTLGLTALKPVVQTAHGIPEAAGPLDSAFMQWDIQPKVKPDGTNTPAPKPKPSESAHLVVRTLASWRKQLKEFYKPNGKAVHPCSGPCGAK